MKNKGQNRIKGAIKQRDRGTAWENKGEEVAHYSQVAHPPASSTTQLDVILLI